MTLASPSSRPRRSMDANTVLQELQKLHNSLQVGAPFPSQRELLERLDASERIVRKALDEFERQGKIIRRVGRGGSIVAEASSASQAHRNTNGSSPLNETKDISSETGSRTIVTIADPDGSIFDRALQLLARHPKAAEFTMNCRLMSPHDADAFELPAPHQKPLGYLVFRKHFESLAQRLQAAGHRVVLVGHPLSEEGVGVPNVYGDHEEGGALLTQHLLQLGHRRLLIHGGEDLMKSQRGLGIQRAIEESGYRVESEWFDLEQTALWKANPQQTRQFFSRGDSPTALMCWNDEIALRLLTLLNSIGLSVPQDVSLVGYDNLPQSAHTHPSLTTVDSAIERQINAALRLLTQPQAPSPNHNLVVLPTLVARESSAAPGK